MKEDKTYTVEVYCRHCKQQEDVDALVEVREFETKEEAEKWTKESSAGNEHLDYEIREFPKKMIPDYSNDDSNWVNETLDNLHTPPLT